VTGIANLVPYFRLGFVLEPGLLQRLVGVAHERRARTELLLALLGVQPARRAGRADVLARQVLLGEREVARIHDVARQLAGFGVAEILMLR